MKFTLFLAAALAFVTSAALAQTVAPGTTPGATTGNPSNMPDAGSSMNHNTSDKMDRTHNRKMHGNKRVMRDDNMKMKTKMDADGTMKTKM